MRLAWLAGLLVLSTPLAAQRGGGGARLDVALPAPVAAGAPGSPPAAAPYVPEVRAIGVLDDRSLRDLLHSGFPARLHFKVELWSSGGLFDELRTQVEWDVIVRYNPLERRYTATRLDAERATSLGSYDALGGVEQALARPFQPAVKPPRARDRSYYTGTLDVEMLSVNDLDEVERWLRGELSPAVHGERNPGTALGRGVKTLITRVLGGEKRHYEARTRSFEVPGKREAGRGKG